MRELDFDALHLCTRVAELGTLSAVAREPQDLEAAGLPAHPDDLHRHGLVGNSVVTPIFAMTQGAKHRLPEIKAGLDWWADWFARPERAAAARTQ